MGRRKKGAITYDSKETATVVGILFLLAGIILVVSMFNLEANKDSLFNIVKSIFGNGTVFAAAFFISTSLRFFGVRHPFNSNSSILGQLLLIFLIPALFTAFSADTTKAVLLLGPERTAGGQVGYFVLRNVFGDLIPTEVKGVPASTKIVLIALSLSVLPLALSFSFKDSIEFLKKIFGWIFKQIDYALISGGANKEEDEHEELNEKASKFGDFNKLLEQKRAASEPVVRKEDIKFNEEPEARVSRPLPSPVSSNGDTDGGDSEILNRETLVQSQLLYDDWDYPNAASLIAVKSTKTNEPSIDQNGRVIEQILASFKIEASVVGKKIGPSVIVYSLDIPLGVKVNTIQTLAENIALALGVDSKAVRIESIQDTTYLGVEVPRSQREMVRIKELMDSSEMKNTNSALPVPIGKDIDGKPIIGDIQKMPHLLIAGATGSGKSVLTNGFISSLIMKKTPDELRMILVDPKQVEFNDYNGIPHLICPVITRMDIVVDALKWLVNLMEKRYGELKNAQVRNIEDYNNKKGFASMPYIVVVIDEMADMMMTANRKEAEDAIVRLAQKARAVGVHLILATQRPSVNVITGIIKANIPGRIAMSVTSSTDSRVILDRIGAESLMGKGDLLYKAPDRTKSARLQCANIEQKEVSTIVQELVSNKKEGISDYLFDIDADPSAFAKALPGNNLVGGGNGDALGLVSGDNLIEQAIRIVAQSGKGSSSYLQRRLNIGFNRAARLLEELEELGVVGAQTSSSKPREVLISDPEEFIMQLKGQN